MKLENVVPWGRSLTEYQAMFALSEEDLQKRILGCGDGPASFNAEMTSSGRQTVTSVDPLYAFSVPDIARRIIETEHLIMADVRTNAASFKWSWFENPDALLGARKKAMSIFLQDYESGKQQKRYVAGALPRLEFATNSFDLCVCAHFLFLYSNQLTLEFRLRSIVELLRLAAEVRIFPLRDLNHERSQHLAPVCDYLQANGFENELVPVNYEFIPEANQMLRVCRKTNAR